MKLKILLVLFCALFISSGSHAQILTPVKWTSSCNKVEEGVYDIILSAKIDKGWNIYSQNIKQGGPVPSALHIDTEVELIGKVQESSSKIEEGFDAIFEMDLVKLKKDAKYVQRIRVKSGITTIKGYMSYMTCDDTKCLPPTDEDFSINLNDCKMPAQTGEVINKAQETSVVSEPIASTLNQADATVDYNTSIATTKPNEKRKVQQTSPKQKPSPIKSRKQNEPDVQKKIEINIANNSAAVVEKKAPRTNKILEPVQWSSKVVTEGKDEFILQFEADIIDGWNMYSKDIEEDGPIPTNIVFEGKAFEAMGALSEKAEIKKKEYDPNFEIDIVKLKKRVRYRQKIKIKDPSKPVGGYIEYMACDDKQCIFPPPLEFVFDPKGKTLSLGEDIWTQAMSTDKGKEDKLSPNDALNFMVLDKNKLNDPVGECKTANRAEIKKGGIWNIFFLGFVGGLIALLTPCVFPMIPLTVSYFTKSSGNKSKGLSQALLYGFFILMVYLLLSVPFHLMDSLNPDILNSISTNVYLNLFFFAIFIFFAFSFFGYYELTLPSSWSNKASQAENVGGVVGIFFMALTLALVSFSCTGPILGSLLAGALTSEGGAFQLTAGMGGFGLALAMPFGLFAAFPSFLNRLPKSGGWLTTVKVVLGFLELALAFKFLSNADLVKNWGLLKIEPFLIIWILIFLALGAYLFGKIRFPHDSPSTKLGPTRKVFGGLSLLFALYLMSGFRYNEGTQSFTPLKLLSGLAPPVGYSWIYPKDCPQNLNCFHDFAEGQAYAKKVNKPILLDFTGYACVNCRKMEEHVWPTKPVYKQIKDDYVLISLYVDDKTALPEDQRYLVEKPNGGTRTLRTKGQKWQHFQTAYFNNNSQPYYVLLSPDGELLNNPVPYTPDKEDYAAFLRCGKQNFDQLK